MQYGGHSSGSGKGRNNDGIIKYGFSLVKGKANHPMEDYHVAKFDRIQGHELGLFAIYDGHLGDNVPAYLQKHLFSNILKEVLLLISDSFVYWSCLGAFKWNDTILHFSCNYSRKSFGLILTDLSQKPMRGQTRQFSRIVLTWGVAGLLLLLQY